MTRLRAALCALAIGSVLMAGAPLAPAVAGEYDDRRNENESRQQAVDEAMATLEEELAHTDATLVQAYAELQAIDAALPAAEAALVAAEALLAQLQREAAIIAQRLVAAEAEEQNITAQVQADTARADEIRAAVGQLARDAYKGDMSESSLSAALDAESTEDFVEQSALADTALRTQTQALRDLEQLNGVNRNREVRLGAVREEVTALKAEADANVLAADAARADAEAKKAQLEQMREEQAQKAAAIEGQKAAQVARQAELEAQQAALEAELAAIIQAQEAERRRQQAAAAAAGQSGGGGGPAPSATGSRPFANPTAFNPWVRTSKYGMRFHPVLQYTRLHAGMDLRAYCGTPLYAAASGTVEWARARSGFGNQVMINHGYWNGASLMTSYNHMTSFAVSGGQSVQQGQLIGYAGNTGLSGACHLHFETYVNGATTDPEPMLN
ncbi:peptidoglycan DD-metalloendopeptidase family protein [Actinotalea ferrariae]|nr:peptidoglycan DD-metalloendopeptidase family protein [Actinotalea ferrariae]